MAALARGGGERPLLCTGDPSTIPLRSGVVLPPAAKARLSVGSAKKNKMAKKFIRRVILLCF